MKLGIWSLELLEEAACSCHCDVMPSQAHLPLVVLMGPTGAGKSALALELAKKYNGEIISADSRQIYLGMDIGTDKPCTFEFRISNFETTRIRHSSFKLRGFRTEPLFCEDVPHYLIDILLPTQRYSAAEFREDAQHIIADIHKRGKLPIVVGGTGFYVRVLTGHRSLPSVPPDPAFRAWAEQQPLADLLQELETRAPDLFTGIDNLKNTRRVIRALEIARARGNRQQAVGSRDARDVVLAPTASSPLPTAFRFLKLALLPPPEILEQRLARRVEEYFRRGFVEEVQALVNAYGADAPGLQSVGYRQVLSHLRGEGTLEETKEAVLRSHRQYVRRQLLWLTKEPELVRVDSPAEALDCMSEFLGKPLPAR